MYENESPSAGQKVNRRDRPNKGALSRYMKFGSQARRIVIAFILKILGLVDVSSPKASKVDVNSPTASRLVILKGEFEN